MKGVFKVLAFSALFVLCVEARGRQTRLNKQDRSDEVRENRRQASESQFNVHMSKWHSWLFSELFPLFNIVSFKNDPCTAASDNSMYGTCMTTSECSSQGGTKDGNCAAGFGVCCTFITSCASAGGTNEISKASLIIFFTFCSLTYSVLELHLCAKLEVPQHWRIGHHLYLHGEHGIQSGHLLHPVGLWQFGHKFSNCQRWFDYWFLLCRISKFRI